MDKPIKVLHFTSLLVGSAYFNNLQTYTNPDKVKYVFATFTKKGVWSKQLEDRGATVYNLDVTKKNEAIDWIDLPKAYKPLVNIVEKEGIDIIHPHLHFPTLLGVGVARLKRRKCVFTRHHSDAIHAIESLIKRRVYLKTEQFVNKNADHIIAPSRMVRDILVETESVPSEKVSLIPYGQTFERFSAITPKLVERKRAELGMDRQLSMVCVSRLFYAKGHIYLFEALASLIDGGLDVKVFLVGTGDYRSTLEAKVKALGIEDHVEFLGWRDDVLPIIASADLVVHPSLEDALSQSLIESLMLERPIVATDISGAGDTLGDGKYGKLVKPADSDNLRKGIEKTISNLDKAGEMATAGRNYLLDYMAAEKACIKHEKIYENVMKNLNTDHGK